MSSFSEAMDRAKARANTLSKLESAFGGTSNTSSSNSNSNNKINSYNNNKKTTNDKSAKTTNTNKQNDRHNTNNKNANNNNNNNANNNNNNSNNSNNSNNNKNDKSKKVSITSTIEIVTRTIGDTSEKTKKRLHDALRGKSIVLENNNNNTNNTNKLININKIRSRKQQRSSRRYLKKNNLCDSFYIPTLETMNSLYQMWVIYIRGVMQLCQSNAEMQAKLYTSEMIGAKIIVLETYKTIPSLNGITGIITSESVNCYYLCINNDDNSKRKQSINSTIDMTTNDMKVIRLIKDNHILGVLLPNIPKKQKSNNNATTSDSHQRDDHVAILYGKKFMPYAKVLN